MEMRTKSFMNVWSFRGRQIESLKFYTREAGVLATSDTGYLPRSADRYCYEAASEVKQIAEVRPARAELPNIARGGHFVIGGTLYLDLSEFDYWSIEEQQVSSGAGYTLHARGIVLQYDASGSSLVGANEFLNIQRFVYDRSKTEERASENRAKLEAVAEWYNRNVADHSNRYLSLAGAERLLSKFRELKAIVEGEL
ncbi:hypothetical protein FBPa45_0126 [Pseudomonas phage vB_PaeS_FBPa45]|nr:hypothetical protein FBPa45_0126 [Pseudomonas phage vB_PaeS_FBPa45]